MEEVQSSQEDGAGLVIEIDSNAWAGEKVILNDPNPQNSNVKLMERIFQKNPNLTLVNSLN